MFMYCFLGFVCFCFCIAVQLYVNYCKKKDLEELKRQQEQLLRRFHGPT